MIRQHQHLIRHMTRNNSVLNETIVVARRHSVSAVPQAASSSSSSSSSQPLSHSSSLPKLPVPSLQSSLGKYLGAVKPLLSESEFEKTRRIAHDFGKSDGLGEKLQKLLLERADKTDNWLSQWWLEKIYLEPRYSVAINVNPGTLYPRANYSTMDEKLAFAAKYIDGFLKFRAFLSQGKLAAEKLGDSQLCMEQYYYLIGTCRVPGKDRDELRSVRTDSSSSSTSGNQNNHVIVMLNTRIFSLQVLDATSGAPLDVHTIHANLRALVERAERTASVSTSAGVGLLTAEHRDVWYHSYERLSQNGENAAHFAKIHSSLFVMCLDNASAKNGGGDICLRTDVDSRSRGASQILHGNKEFTANRFFDKAIQVVLADDGVWGINCEHSIAEALPHGFMNDFIYKSIMESKEELPAQTTSNDESNAPRLFEELCFHIPADIEERIIKSSYSIYRAIDNLDMFVLSFDAFGKNLAKAHKISPDAFVQIAMQLAYYRASGGRVANTYETGSLRRFRLGRTEIIRTLSTEAIEFVRAMPLLDLNNNNNNNTLGRHVSNSERLRLLHRAIQAHRAYTERVLSGESFDRHLLALRLIATENRMPLGDLYADEAFKSLNHFHISSSQITSRLGYDTVSFYGPAVEDGYGCSYNITEAKLFFGITAYKTCKTTSARLYAECVRNALLDCQSLLLKISPRL